MKNHKGAVAALLTLGLVIIGTLITLGTSLFVNKTKNIASNARASCGVYHACSLDKPEYLNGGYYISGSKYYKDSSCGTEVTEGVGNYCKSLNSAPVVVDTCQTEGGGTCTEKVDCSGTTVSAQNGFCSGKYGSNFVCCKNSGGAANTCESQGNFCLNLISGASDSCAPNAFIGMGSTMCGDAKKVCCNGNKPQTAASGNPPASSPFQCTTGNPVVVSGTCDSTCTNQGSTYVSNSQGDGSDGKHYCCCKSTDSGSGFDTCYKAYAPVPGASQSYGCKNTGENKVVIYAQSMSAVQMPSCEAYNSDTNTSLYFAQVPNKYANGACVQGLWDGNLSLNAPGGKHDQAQGATTGLKKCSDGITTATCTFGDGDASTVGPGVCNGLTEPSIKGCKPVQTKPCNQYTDIHSCVAAQNSNIKCVWLGAPTNKCVDDNNSGGTSSGTCNFSCELGESCSCLVGSDLHAGTCTKAGIPGVCSYGGDGGTGGCTGGATATCIFGNNNNSSGPGMCGTEIKESISGCNPIPNNPTCEDFDRTICGFINTATSQCIWDQSMNTCKDYETFVPPVLHITGGMTQQNRGSVVGSITIYNKKDNDLMNVNISVNGPITTGNFDLGTITQDNSKGVNVGFALPGILYTFDLSFTYKNSNYYQKVSNVLSGSNYVYYIN